MVKASATHEDFRPHTENKGGSNRSFGLVFTLVFAAVAVLPALHGRPIRVWAVPISGLFLIAALVRPDVLQPLNRLWTKFGSLLNKIMSPVIIGILFFVVITPVGLLMRMFATEQFKKRPDPLLTTYWTHRDPPGPAPATMANQF